MRMSGDEIVNSRLMNGFDYENQAWVKDGKYIRCGHPEGMNCKCYGRLHEGEETMPEAPETFICGKCDRTVPIDNFVCDSSFGPLCDECAGVQQYRQGMASVNDY
jgi:hypothetical protein